MDKKKPETVSLKLLKCNPIRALHKASEVISYQTKYQLFIIHFNKLSSQIVRKNTNYFKKMSFKFIFCIFLQSK